MYNGYERSPSSLFVLCVRLSLQLPHAPSQTTNGNMSAMQTNSYRLLRLISPQGLMYGTAKRTIRIMLQIQNAPLALRGLNVRASNIPMLKGKSMRTRPPQKFTSSMVQPTPIMSYPEMLPMKNHAWAMPKSRVNRARTVVGNLRMTSA